MDIMTCTRYIVSVEHTETFYNKEIECSTIETANKLITELLTNINPNKPTIVRVAVRRERYKLAEEPLKDNEVTYELD